MIAGAVLAYKPPHSHSLTPDLLDGGPLPAQPRSRAHTVEDAEPSVSPPPPCASLSCTNRLTALEPSWVNLSFQPRIDWQAGGLRGDCVVGEYEYIMHAYCDPPGAHTPAALGQRPSLERLVSADVHTQALPKAGFAELAALVGNRTLLIMGDSVMEQFYNALQCMLRREGLERPTDAAFRAFIELNRPLWTMGARSTAAVAAPPPAPRPPPPAPCHQRPAHPHHPRHHLRHGLDDATARRQAQDAAQAAAAGDLGHADALRARHQLPARGPRRRAAGRTRPRRLIPRTAVRPSPPHLARAPRDLAPRALPRGRRRT